MDSWKCARYVTNRIYNTHWCKTHNPKRVSGLLLRSELYFKHLIRQPIAEQIHSFLAATKQLYEWFSPSVCPSVFDTLFTMFLSSYHHEIFRSYYRWQNWGTFKRSRSEVKDQGHRGQHSTSPFPDCNSSLNSHMMMKWCTELDVA